MLYGYLTVIVPPYGRDFDGASGANFQTVLYALSLAPIRLPRLRSFGAGRVEVVRRAAASGAGRTSRCSGTRRRCRRAGPCPWRAASRAHPASRRNGCRPRAIRPPRRCSSSGRCGPARRPRAWCPGRPPCSAGCRPRRAPARRPMRRPGRTAAGPPGGRRSSPRSGAARRRRAGRAGRSVGPARVSASGPAWGSGWASEAVSASGAASASGSAPASPWRPAGWPAPIGDPVGVAAWPPIEVATKRDDRRTDRHGTDRADGRGSLHWVSPRILTDHGDGQARVTVPRPWHRAGYPTAATGASGCRRPRRRMSLSRFRRGAFRLGAWLTNPAPRSDHEPRHPGQAGRQTEAQGDARPNHRRRIASAAAAKAIRRAG